MACTANFDAANFEPEPQILMKFRSPCSSGAVPRTSDEVDRLPPRDSTTSPQPPTLTPATRYPTSLRSQLVRGVGWVPLGVRCDTCVCAR